MSVAFANAPSRIATASCIIALASFSWLGFPSARADSGELWSPERLIPEENAPIKSDFNLRMNGDDDHLRGEAFARTPLYQSENGTYLLLEGHGIIGHFWDGEDSFFQGTAGLVLRAPIDDNHAFGINGFFDFGAYDGFAGQGSFGIEYENVGMAARSFRLGGNVYLPLDDYTADPVRTRAPRFGGDFYVGMGKQWSDQRLDLFLTGFHYAATSNAFEIWGGTSEIEWRYENIDILPDGSHFFARGGIRYDTFEDGLSPIFGIGISVALNDAPTRHDRVAEVRRNIAFGSAFVPIERKPPIDPNDCGPGNPRLDEMLLTPAVAIVDGTADPPYFVPVGTPLGTIMPSANIDAMCTFSGVVSPACVAAVAELDNAGGAPIPVNGGGLVQGSKAAGTCAWRAQAIGE